MDQKWISSATPEELLEQLLIRHHIIIKTDNIAESSMALDDIEHHGDPNYISELKGIEEAKKDLERLVDELIQRCNKTEKSKEKIKKILGFFNDLINEVE